MICSSFFFLFFILNAINAVKYYLWNIKFKVKSCCTYAKKKSKGYWLLCLFFFLLVVWNLSLRPTKWEKPDIIKCDQEIVIWLSKMIKFVLQILDPLFVLSLWILGPVFSVKFHPRLESSALKARSTKFNLSKFRFCPLDFDPSISINQSQLAKSTSITSV